MTTASSLGVRSLITEGSVKRLCAVVPCPHSHAFLVEEEREVGGVHCPGVEGHQSGAGRVAGGRGTVELQAVYSGELVV